MLVVTSACIYVIKYRSFGHFSLHQLPTQGYVDNKRYIVMAASEEP